MEAKNLWFPDWTRKKFKGDPVLKGTQAGIVSCQLISKSSLPRTHYEHVLREPNYFPRLLTGRKVWVSLGSEELIAY